MKRRLSIVPKAFLFFFPLHMGAELIIAIGLLNKASGFYGILSIFTGHPLSVMEWILNILSLVTLPLYILAFQTIHTRNALRMVLFAYLYSIDTLCSVGFSIYFCVHWFTEKAKVVAASGSESSPGAAATSSAAPSMATNASADVYRRDSAEGNAINKSASLPQETATTITITVVFLLVRLYFNLIILAYARQLVRQQNLRPHNGSNQSTLKGRVQYIALSIAQSFWTGSTWSSTSAALSSSSSSSSVSSVSGSRRGNLDEATTRLNSDFDDVDDHQYSKE